MISYFDPATDTDFGTPARESEVQVSLNIDGRSISVPAGTSVMRAAAMLGTSIPKLCATDSVEAFGSCRLCVVEIEGRRGTPGEQNDGMLLRPPACPPRRAPVPPGSANSYRYSR